MSTTPIEPPPYAGCLWPVDPACYTDDWLAMDEDVRARALRLASDTLWRLSGYRVTNCPITVRPRPSQTVCDGPGNYLDLDRGHPFGRIGGRSAGRRTSAPHYTRLAMPVGRIDQVKIGDQVLPPSSYAMDGQFLVRTDGEPWPSNPDMLSPLGEPDTWSVTYIKGYPVDANAAYAVGTLAMEFAKACSGDSKCKLPATVTSIVRQGITMTIPTGAFPEGVTGIKTVDAWIALWRPEGAPSRAAVVVTPDIVLPLVVHGHVVTP